MDTRKIVSELVRLDGNQTVTAIAIGVTQPTVSRWLAGGTVEVENRDKLRRYAIRRGVLSPSQNLEPTYVQVVGYIIQGGKVDYGAQEELSREAPVPPDGESDHLVAIEVRGDGMAGMLDDGSLVYYENHHEPPSPDLLNRICVVSLLDGRTFVKRLVPGSTPHHFHLQSTNGPALLDQPVAWAARIVWIKPK